MLIKLKKSVNILEPPYKTKKTTICKISIYTVVSKCLI